MSTIPIFVVKNSLLGVKGAEVNFSINLRNMQEEY